MDQITSRFRKELTTKYLVIEEISKTVKYHQPEPELSNSSYYTPSFLEEKTKKDPRWEIQITIWSSQVYLDTPSLTHLLETIELDIRGNNSIPKPEIF